MINQLTELDNPLIHFLFICTASKLRFVFLDEISAAIELIKHTPLTQSDWISSSKSQQPPDTFRYNEKYSKCFLAPPQQPNHPNVLLYVDIKKPVPSGFIIGTDLPRGVPIRFQPTELIPAVPVANQNLHPVKRCLIQENRIGNKKCDSAEIAIFFMTLARNTWISDASLKTSLQSTLQ